MQSEPAPHNIPYQHGNLSHVFVKGLEVLTEIEPFLLDPEGESDDGLDPLWTNEVQRWEV